MKMASDSPGDAIARQLQVGVTRVRDVDGPCHLQCPIGIVHMFLILTHGCWLWMLPINNDDFWGVVGGRGKENRAS
jgi:hypothetical protein